MRRLTMACEPRRALACAIYTRKSTEHGLEQDFNSLDAQREAAEAFVKSQAHEGWRCLPDRYDDGGISGGSLDRPALQQLLSDIKPARSTWWSSIRSTGSRARSWISQSSSNSSTSMASRSPPSPSSSTRRPPWDGSR